MNSSTCGSEVPTSVGPPLVWTEIEGEDQLPEPAGRGRVAGQLGSAGSLGRPERRLARAATHESTRTLRGRALTPEGEPPYGALDLVGCRNLLIYLEQAAQGRALGRLHFALGARGLLLLGSSESTRAGESLFAPLDPAHRLYRKRAEGLTSRCQNSGGLDAAPSAGAER